MLSVEVNSAWYLSLKLQIFCRFFFVRKVISRMFWTFLSVIFFRIRPCLPVLVLWCNDLHIHQVIQFLKISTWKNIDFQCDIVFKFSFLSTFALRVGDGDKIDIFLNFFSKFSIKVCFVKLQWVFFHPYYFYRYIKIIIIAYFSL